MPDVTLSYPHTDAILSAYKHTIGKDFEGYRNHVTRMLNFLHYLLPDISAEESDKVQIASAFHDIGLWTENRVDYLEPSIAEAHFYLDKINRPELKEEIQIIIDMHHLIFPYKGKYERLVETFRKADLTDFSLGVISNGVDRNFIKQVKNQLPNAGFHKTLGRFTLLQLTRNPLNPLPMMRIKNIYKK